MRKITIEVGHGGITLLGDISEVSSQLIGNGWLNRSGGFYKDNATMGEVKSIIDMYGEPHSASEKIERDIEFRTDPNGHVLVEGNTSPLKDRLKSAGGIWHARPKCWSFQNLTSDKVKTLVSDLVNTGICDTKTFVLIWNNSDSPIFSGDTSTPYKSPTSPEDPHSVARRFSGDIPSETVARSVERDGNGKIIRVTGIPVPGVTDPSSTKAKCSLCGSRGHTRTDCICPFCRYINIHNPMDCPTRVLYP